MNNHCETCDHKRHPDGGHCYMFRVEPDYQCQKHTLHGKPDVVPPGYWLALTAAMAAAPKLPDQNCDDDPPNVF